jgi:hypothetical protein
MNACTATKRRWFRFSLSTLFVVVTIFGCWLGYQLNWIRQRRLADEWIAANPPQMLYDLTYEPKSLPWSLRILGEQKRGQIVVSTRDKARLEEIRALFPEANICNLGFFPTSNVVP